MYEFEVVIIGAGPTGLTLAIDLARRGIGCRVLESAAAPFIGSRGKGIQPRTLEIFEDLGVIQPVLAAGGLYPRLRLHLGPVSIRLGSLGSAKPATESVPYPNLWMVPQGRTETILRERLEALGGRVGFGDRLVDLRQDEAGVEATLTGGETVRARFLVGCDGGRSTVRRALGLQLEGETMDEKPALVADVEVAGLSRDDWHVWPLAKVGLCPLPSTSLFQLTVPAELVGNDIEGAIYKATGKRITQVAWSSIYQPAVRMVYRYRVGRVLLAGDAAHVHPPAGGQGLNTGVQDAYNLGWKLAHVLRGGPDSLLDTYEEERLPVAAAVLGLSKRLVETRSLKRGDATNQLALHYRGSSLCKGESIGKLHPGDRMPDMRLGDGSRLFEQMRGPHATEIEESGGVRILIRPDGYIARIGMDSCQEFAGLAVTQVDAGRLD